MLAVFLLVVSLLHVSSAAPKKCYEHNRDFYPYFSTRSAYEYVRGHISRPQTSNTCKPVQVWMLARHGTRYPSKKSMSQLFSVIKIRNRIIKKHKKGAGSLCPRDLKKLKNWQLAPDFDFGSAASLSFQGKNDLYQLAKRLRNAFPELLQVDPSNVEIGDFLFRSSKKERSQESMKSFSSGLFDTSRTVVPFENPPVNDTLLLAHKNCPAWKAGIESEPVIAEREKFTKGTKIRSLIQNLTLRLGFSKLLTFDDVKAMYDMCRFETALYLNRTSTWCTLFTKDELKILEYREDLDHYYYSGPGRQINAKLGCQTLSDMFKHFRKLTTTNSTTGFKGVFYFAHTVTLQALMSALDINRESKPLLAEDYATSQNRKYRTSLLGPFATNVVAVLYSCNETLSSQFKVSFHVAEKLIEIPGCDNGLCDWDYIEKKFDSDVKHCTMNFCYE